MRRSPWLLLILLTWACQPKPEDLIETLEIVGCRDLRKGPICEIDGPTKLVIWVKVKEGAKVAIKTDHGPAAVKFHPYEDGYRTRFIATATAGAVIVEARRKGIDTRRWPLELHEKSELLKEAERLQSEGKEAEAKEKWEVLKDSKEPREAAEALKQLGGYHARRGEIAEASALWTFSVEIAARSGLASRAVNERLSAVQLAIDADRDLEGAVQGLREVERVLLTQDALGRLNHGYYQAALALRTGNLREAEVATRSVVRAAGRLDRQKTGWAGRLLVGQIYGEMGRNAERRYILSELRDHEVTKRQPCNEGDVLIGLTWASVVEAYQSGRIHPDAFSAAQAAAELYDNRCPDRDQAGNSAINLGLLHALAGEVTLAQQQLAKARELGAESALERRLWLRELEARLAFADGAPSRALDRYEAMDREGGGASAAVAWRAQVGRANALVRLDRKVEARVAFRKAAEILRSEAIAVALDGGRAHFLASRRQATVDEIELLLSMDRPGDALEVAREARVRTFENISTAARLRGLSDVERGRWTKLVEGYRAATRAIESSLDASWGQAKERAERERAIRAAALEARRANLEEALSLFPSATPNRPPPHPRPDELLLLYTHLGQDRWLAFAKTSSAVRVVRVTANPSHLGPTELGHTFLEPFGPELTQTRRVRLMVEAELHNTDLHAAPWGGGHLQATHLVQYALDRPDVARPAAGQSVLLAIDPRGDLPQARDEGAWVSKVLSARGPVTVLQAANATREAIVSSLQSTAHFHFSGHGQIDSSGGLESGLLVARGQTVSVGDILTLPRAPAAVVLSSCEATSPGQSGLPQVGLAEAFVLAGADQVVGPSRPISDALARRFTEALYRRPEQPLEQAYLQAINEVAAALPAEDWASFRMVTP